MKVFGKLRRAGFLIISMLMCFYLFGSAISVKAASSFSNSTTAKQLFAVPGGGWSSINVKVIYRENYIFNGSKNILNNREKTVFFKRAYATSCPTVTLGNVSHSNGTVFSSWCRSELWIDSSKWDSGSCYVNTQSVSYSTNTSITGTLPFLLACGGGVPAQVPRSLDLSFK